MHIKCLLMYEWLDGCMEWMDGCVVSYTYIICVLEAYARFHTHSSIHPEKKIGRRRIVEKVFLSIRNLHLIYRFK